MKARALIVAAFLAALVGALVAGAVAPRAAPAALGPPGGTELHFVSVGVGGTLGATDVRSAELVLAAGPDPVQVTPAPTDRARPEALPPGGSTGGSPALVASGAELPAPEVNAGRRSPGPTTRRPRSAARAPWRPG